MIQDDPQPERGNRKPGPIKEPFGTEPGHRVPGRRAQGYSKPMSCHAMLSIPPVYSGQPCGEAGTAPCARAPLR